MKQRLVETFSVGPGVIKELTLTEENKRMVESSLKSFSEKKIGGEFGIYGVYKVPIWRIGEKNLNGRIYSRKLAERIVKENKVTFSLPDHPKENESGKVTEILAVSRDPFIEGNILYCKTYVIDEEFNKKIRAGLMLGASFGVSSSGLGELDENNNVVAETYELERYHDFVLDPSYQVYITKESILDENTSLSSNNTSTIYNESLESKKEVEKVMSNEKKLSPLEVKNITKNLRDLLEKAKASSILERKKYLSEAVDWLSEAEKEGYNDVETKNLIEKFVNETNKEIESLVEKGSKMDLVLKEKKEALIKNLNKVRNDYNLLKRKYEKALDILDGVKSYSKKYRALFESERAKLNGMISINEYKELDTYNEYLKKQIKSLKKENLILTQEIDALQEELSSLKKKHFLDKEKDIKLKNRFIKESDSDDIEEIDLEDEEDIPSNNTKDDEILEDDFAESYKKNFKKKINSKGRKIFEEEDDEDEDEDNVKNSTEEDEKEDTIDKENEEDKEKEEIKEYYYSLFRKNPAVKQIKEDILRCKSLIEAQKTFYRLNKILKLNEDRLGSIRTKNVEDNITDDKYKKPISILELSHKGWD